MYIIQTCMYMFILLCRRFESYKHVHTTYKPVYWVLCSSFQCTDGYIHVMKCTDMAEPGKHNEMSFWMQLFYLRSQPAWYPRNRQSGRLKLQRDGVRLHFGVYFHHCSLVLECLCICAVLKIESMMRACRCNLYSCIFYTTEYLPGLHWDPSVRMTTPMKVEEYP